METGVVITQEQVFTKTSVEEAHAGVVLDHSTMDVDKVNLSTVLDNSSIQGEPEVAEVVNGSGETEESKHENEEVMKTISVAEDSKIVKEKASETETDEEGTDDAKIILTDMTLEKEKEDETTQKPEAVSEKPVTEEEGQTETKHSQEEEKDMSKAREEILIKTDEGKEEINSTTVDTSVNGTEAEHNETVSVQEISNISKETAPEEETTTHDVETTERIDPEGETKVQESISPKEDAETVEAIKNSDDAEQVSREVVTGDKEKEEDIIHKGEEVQEIPTVIETPTIHGDDIELKASKDTEEHEHVLVRDIPQDETLVPKDDTSTVQESAILNTLETKTDERDAEPSLESDEVLVEPPKLSPDQRSIETEEDEHVLGSKMPQGEAESLVTKEDREQEDKEQEKIDLALKEELMDEKKEAYQVAGAQNVERGLALNESGAEETPVIKHPDVESGEQPEELSEETRKTLDEKIQEKTEEVAPHQEGQEEGSYGSETVPVPESIELKEKAQEERIFVLAPLQEESCLPNEQDEQVKSASSEGETLVESKKNEEIKSSADKLQSILEIVDTGPVKSKEETTVHESISLKDDSDTVEESKNSDDAEKVSHEVTGDREKEEDIIIHKALEVQESLTVVETPTIQGEDIELKASKDTNEEHEHVLVRDIPQEETLVPKAETVNTSTVHESAEPSLGLKEKEETIKTVTSSDEVKESITLMEPPEQIPKDTEEDEQVLRSSKLQGDTIITEAESLVTKENKEQEDKDQEKTEGVQEVPTDLALKVDKEEVIDEKKEADEFVGGQNMERGLELNMSEADLVDQNATDETEEKQSIESPSEETSKTLDEKIQEKTEEKVAPHQEGQEEGSYGSETKDETVPVQLKEKSQEERLLDITPLQDEEEIKEKIHKHEPANEQVKSDEVIQVSSASPPEGETLVEATKASEEEQVADKIQSILETVDTEPVKSNEDDITESLNSAGEEIQIKSKVGENVQLDETGEEKASSTPETSVINGREEGISKNNEIIVHETNTEEIKNSHEVTGDREKQEVQESPTVIETEVLQEDNIELKDSKDTMEYEHVLVIDMPQIDTLVTKVQDVNTSTVHKFEATTSKTLETTSDETEVGQETQKYIELSLGLKEDKEKEETETVESAEKMQTSSLECPCEVSEEKSTTVGEKMEEKLQEEETLSVQEIKNHGEEVSCLQQEPIEKYEPTNDQQSPVEEKSDEGGIIVNAVKLEDNKENEEEQVVEETVSETTEDEKVKKEEPIDQILSEEDAIKSHVTEDDNESLTSERKKGDEEITVRAMPQGETNVNEAETVDTSTVQEAAVSNILETNINESEAVHSPIDGQEEEEERQVTKEDTEPSLDLKGDKEQAETETVDEVIKDESQGRQESAEIKYKEKDAKLVDDENMQRPSLESPSVETSKTVDEKIKEEEEEEEVTLHQESEETVTVPESSELGVQAKEEEEEESDQASAAPLSEQREGEDLKENEKEPVEASRPDGTESSKLVEEHKEILEVEKEVPSSETIPQETLSDDVMAIQLKREVNATTTESHEEEATVAQTRDIEVSETPAQIPKKIEKIHEEIHEEEEEETNEPHKVEALSGQNLPVEASDAHHPTEIVSELDDKTAKKVEEIHEEEEEEETKTVKLQQEEEILPAESVPSESFSERHVSAVTEESVGETKPKESDDQIESSTKATKVEDDTQVVEIVKGQSLSHAPEDAGLEQKEELKDLGTLQHGAAMEDQDSVMNENSSVDFTFSNPIGEAEHGDENSSTLPVVGILKELQTTLEEKERGINNSEGGSSGNGLKSINAEPEALEKTLVVEETPASEIIEANMLQDSISRELEVVNDVEEQLHVETPADLSLTQVLPGLIPSKQEEVRKQDDINASTSEKISLQEEKHPRDFEISKKEHNAEAQETLKEEDQTFDIEEEKKKEVLQDEKLSTISPEVNNNNNNNQEDASELGVGQVEKEKEAHSVFGNAEEVNEVSVVAEKELTEEHVKSQAVSDDTKSSNEMDFTSEQIPKDQREEAEETADASEKVLLQVRSKEFGQEKQSTDLKYVQEDLDDEMKDDGHDSVLANKKDSDLIEEKKEVDYVKTEPEDAIKHGVSIEEKNMCEKIGQEAKKEIYQEKCKQTDTATAIKEEIKDEEKETTEDNLISMKNTDDGIKDYELDSVVAQKTESGSIEEKKEADYVKTELEDVIEPGLPTEVNNNLSGKFGQEATKEIYQEECKQQNTVTAIKKEIKEEKKETPEDFLNSMKNTDDATEKTKPEIQEIDKLSHVSETQDKPPKQGDEVPTQQKREIADDVPKLENLKIAEEVQQKDGEDETEPIGKEPARKSLSELIQNVKVTDKTEVPTTEPRIEEEAKAEGEDEDGDEHKDDKTSPDSIVMVEAKDTVSIIKTQKKSHGILSGVGSKVKHSISKVKKALTGKSSHTTKPSSPQ